MTTTHPHESALTTERITAYADTLLSLTKGRQMINHPCFALARTKAFIHELTDKQLDHVVARLLQLSHDGLIRYSFVGAIRNLVGDSDAIEFIEFGERK
jgi:hypothetical protein